MNESASAIPPSDSARLASWRVALAILAGMVFFGILYKYTLRAWFQEDDFAWLGLRLQVHGWQDFLHAMFAPMAQGTIRPLSERAFFMTFFSWFGLNALPYRIVVYVTQLGNIALLSIVALKLTKSTFASFCAPILWIANSVLAWPLTWTSAYNEVLCSFIFLLSFLALLLYVETGNWRFNALQWVSFLIGFGVLEINVMYPLLALSYVWLFAPHPFRRKTALLIVPSAIFTVVDVIARARPSSGIYRLHADASIFSTLLAYWNRALGAMASAEIFPQLRPFALGLTIFLSVAILAFVVFRTLRSDRLPLFCLGWFVIALAPFLPVRDHISDYYLTVPSIGLALLGAYAILVGLKRNWANRAITIAVVALYLGCSIPAARNESQSIWAASVPVKKLVLGVRAAHQRDPGRTILLEGVGYSLFWNGVFDRPFRLFGADQVYLTPDAVRKIPPTPGQGNVADYALPEDKVRAELAQNRAIVYGVETGDLRDITALFKSTFLESALPRRIELGHPPMDSLLDASWYSSEGEYRWMPAEASVRLGAPANGRGEVRVVASCSPIQVQSRPLLVWLSIGNKTFPSSKISDCAKKVVLKAPVEVPPGQKEVNVTVHVDRTIRVGSDVRDLGLAVSSIEVVDRL